MVRRSLCVPQWVIVSNADSERELFGIYECQEIGPAPQYTGLQTLCHGLGEVFSPVTGIELTWTTQTCSAEPSTAHWSCLCSSSLLTATQLYSVSNQIEEISDYQWPGILVSHEHSLCLLWVPPGRKHLVSVECMTTAKLEYNSFRSHTRLNLLVCRKSEKDLGRDQKHDNQTKALPEDYFQEKKSAYIFILES